MAAHVQEGQMRREIRVRQPSRGSRVAGALVFEAGTHAVMQEQVHRRLLLPGHIRDVERAQRVVLRKAMLVGLDDAGCRNPSR